MLSKSGLIIIVSPLFKYMKFMLIINWLLIIMFYSAEASMIVTSAQVPSSAFFSISPYISNNFDSINNSNCIDYQSSAVIAFEIYATAPCFSVQVNHNSNLSDSSNDLISYTLKNEETIINNSDILHLKKGKNNFIIVLEAWVSHSRKIYFRSSIH